MSFDKKDFNQLSEVVSDINKENANKKKEIEVTLANGYTVQLFEYEGRMVLGLVDSNGFYVSDTKLTDTEIKTLKEMVSS
jgi:hypothetical protein